jgi:hypothetical protein
VPYQQHGDRIHGRFCRRHTQQHFTSLFAHLSSVYVRVCERSRSEQRLYLRRKSCWPHSAQRKRKTALKWAHIVPRPESKVFRCNCRCRPRDASAAGRFDPVRQTHQRQTSAPSGSGCDPRVFAQMKFETCYYYAIPHNLCKLGQVGHLKADSLRARLQRKEFLIKESAAFGSVQLVVFFLQELPRDKV